MPLPALQIVQLHCLICRVAGEQKVIARPDSQSKAHEQCAVHTHSCRKHMHTSAGIRSILSCLDDPKQLFIPPVMFGDKSEASF